ncbi:MAG: fatty acyl-AMP ligase [Microthrixaceae bacterium]|nr:fatty acyl-AMP ligase [Microthrixaceae bacterium]
MLSLIDRIENVAEYSGRTITFVSGDDHETASWAELHNSARAAAAGLQARGVSPGDHVALLGPTTRNLITAIQAVWITGATLVTMPLPMRMGALEVFIEQTRNRIRRSDSSLVLIDPELMAFVEPIEGDPPFVSLDELCGPDGPGADDYERPKSDPDALAVLQFTSGSTSEPKGVMLKHSNICHNLDGAWEAARVTSNERVVSWLPLYHDMGLIGLLTIPMTLGTDLVQGAPQDFLAKPLRWMRWISDFGGTATAGPNFAYALAARTLRRCEEPLDLSNLRVLLNGAEPVDPATFRRFFDAAERFGLDPGSAFPAFGMAEVCIAGTFPEPGRGLQTDWVDKRSLEIDQEAVEVDPESEGATELALLGRPVPGMEMRIVDPLTGEDLPDRKVGELQLRGESVTSGYYKREDATEELLGGGWLRTGDLSYTVDGELVVCGRSKDVIIVGGRNVYPQDVEKVVGQVEGVRTGNVIAFGVDGRHGAQNIVVVAESKGGNLDEIRREVTSAVTQAEGIPPKEVILVEPGSVPKTSSGKLQRSAAKASYESDDLVVLGD